MATTDLSIPQRATLLTLMVAGREVPNPELLGTFGVSLKAEHRRELEHLGYVTTRKGARGAVVLELTDRGWRACHDQLTAGPPPQARSLGNTLYTLLAGLSRFLDRSELRLADVFSHVETDVVAGPSGGEAADQVDVDQRIRQAYRKLVSRPRGWVGLVDLRRQLDGISDQAVDAALTAMFRSQRANLVPESNQKALTDEDRRAAVHVGGEDKHLLSIEDE